MNLRETLEGYGFGPSHPALTALAAFRGGHIVTNIKPESQRFKNAALLMCALATLGAPATATEIRAWFSSIIPCVKTGNMESDAIVSRADGVALAFSDVPRFLFGAELTREVLKKCEWLPTAAEIWALIEQTVTDFNRLVTDLNLMLGRSCTAALPAPDEVLALGGGADNTKVIPIRRID